MITAKHLGARMAGEFSNQFRLSITKALGDQLAEELGKLTPAALTSENLAKLDQQAVDERLSSRSGVYQLYRRESGEDTEKLIYVGKADKPLSQRLGNHLRKISGRLNISIDEMSFKCLYVAEDFSAVAPEKLLIKRYRKDGSIPWNTNGFGNKDPGRNRDNSELKKNHFDVQFPIDLDRPAVGLPTAETSLASLLEQVKDVAPYNLRYADPKKNKDIRAVYEAIRITLPPEVSTMGDVFRVISEHLPERWKISALMGYVILYPDASATYNGAFRYYDHGQIREVTPKLKAAGKIEEDPEE